MNYNKILTLVILSFGLISSSANAGWMSGKSDKCKSSKCECSKCKSSKCKCSDCGCSKSFNHMDKEEMKKHLKFKLEACITSCGNVMNADMEDEQCKDSCERCQQACENYLKNIDSKDLMKDCKIAVEDCLKTLKDCDNPQCKACTVVCYALHKKLCMMWEVCKTSNKFGSRKIDTREGRRDKKMRPATHTWPSSPLEQEGLN